MCFLGGPFDALGAPTVISEDLRPSRLRAFLGFLEEGALGPGPCDLSGAFASEASAVSVEPGTDACRCPKVFLIREVHSVTSR